MSDNTTFKHLFDTLDENLQPMPKSGGTFTGDVSAPTQLTTDDSTKVATTAYVKDNLENYLPLSGGTLTGNIYGTPYVDATATAEATGNIMIVIKDPTVVKGDIPESSHWYTIGMATDSTGSVENGHKFGQIESALYKTTGATVTKMSAYKNELDTNLQATIAVGWDADGNKYTEAPTPTLYDSSTQIATTAFCNSQYNSTYVPDNIIGIEYVASPTDDRGKWRRINKFSQIVDPLPSYFNNHPIYGAINNSYVDDCSMINIPKFYFLYQKTSTGHKWWISNASFTIDGVGTSIVHPGFVYSGAEKAQFYVGAYECSAQNKNSTDMARSIGSGSSNVMPLVSIDFNTMVARCQNRNTTSGVTGFDLWNIYQLGAIQMLCLIEMGGPDVQQLIGRGNDIGRNGCMPCGHTTAEWRGIHELWANAWHMVRGLENRSGTYYWWGDAGNTTFSSSGITVPSGGWPTDISNVAAAKGLFLPTAVGGQAASMFNDYFWSNNSQTDVCYHGGSWDNGANDGLFTLHVHNLASYSGTYVGGRLAKI